MNYAKDANEKGVATVKCTSRESRSTVHGGWETYNTITLTNIDTGEDG